MITGALEKLRELRGEQALPRTPAGLPADWRCEFEERAAIREYDGGQAREHAEAEACHEILARMRAGSETLRYRG